MSQKQENLGLYRQIFDLDGQVNEPGSVSNIKTVTTFIAMRNIYVGIFDGIPLKPYFSGLPSHPGGQKGEKLLPQRFPASCDHWIQLDSYSGGAEGVQLITNYIQSRIHYAIVHYQIDQKHFHIFWILTFSADYMNGGDMGLSEADFKALVKELVANLDYLPWIWGKAEGIVMF